LDVEPPVLCPFDEAFGGGAAGQWAFVLAGPATARQFGAAFIAAAVEHVVVARQESPRSDQLLGMTVAGEPSQTVRPWAAYHSPATTGSAWQWVGPSVPRNTIPPHPVAMT
jgi:hypothetical protein